MDRFYVYIIYSESKDIFYKGQTQNIEKRITYHNNGLETFTKSSVPWTLIWSIQKPSRGEAMKLEQKLKNLSKSRLVKFMNKYIEGASSPDSLLLLKQWSGY